MPTPNTSAMIQNRERAEQRLQAEYDSARHKVQWVLERARTNVQMDPQLSVYEAIDFPGGRYYSLMVPSEVTARAALLYQMAFDEDRIVDGRKAAEEARKVAFEQAIERAKAEP